MYLFACDIRQLSNNGGFHDSARRIGRSGESKNKYVNT